MILGLIAGNVLRSGREPRSKTQWLVVAGVVGLASGWLLGALGIVPVVKRIWTPSWARGQLWTWPRRGRWCRACRPSPAHPRPAYDVLVGGPERREVHRLGALDVRHEELASPVLLLHVDGEPVVKGGAHLHLDREAVLERARLEADKLRRRAKL